MIIGLTGAAGSGKDSVADILVSTSVTPGADVGDDYTLDDTILARKILLNLGFAMHPSMEPGADERVDRVAKMLAGHRSAIHYDHPSER